MPFRWIAAPVLVSVLALAGTSCRFGQGKGDPNPEGEPVGETGAPAPPEVEMIRGGTVRLVRAPLGFVLIESVGVQPPVRSELTVMRKGQPVGTLIASPEAKTGFVVADIVSGNPKVGDDVMWAKSTAPASTMGGTLPTLPDLPPPSIHDLPPLSPGPATDPRNVRPVPHMDARPPVAPMPAPGDPEAELERELRASGGFDPAP